MISFHHRIMKEFTSLVQLTVFVAACAKANVICFTEGKRLALSLRVAKDHRVIVSQRYYLIHT